VIGAALALSAAFAAQPCVVRSGGPGAGVVLDSSVPLAVSQPTDLALVGRGLVTAGSGAELRCAADAFELLEGRVWLRADRTLALRAGGRAIMVGAATSAVVEVQPGDRPTVAVAAGWVELAGVGRLSAGEVAHQDRVQVGGDARFDAFLRDAGGRRWLAAEVRAELLRRLATLAPRRPGPSGSPGASTNVVRGDAERWGADGGPAGRLLEAGVRPEPFAPRRAN